MNDEELQKTLEGAPLPEPVGGHEATRERLMDRVRREFPAAKPAPLPLWRRYGTPAAALLSAGGVAALFLLWPAPPPQEHLPDDALILQLYDQHQNVHDSHVAETPEAG